MRPASPQNFDLDLILGRLPPSSSTALEFRRREAIFTQGSPSGSIFYLETGIVKLTVNSEEGREAVIAFVSTSTFFGHETLESPQPLRSTNAIAHSKVRAIRIDAQAFRRLLSVDPACSNIIVGSLLGLIARMREALTNQLLYNTDKRLHRVLASLEELRGNYNPAPRISQQELASMIGVTRQRVNLTLQRIRQHLKAAASEHSAP